MKPNTDSQNPEAEKKPNYKARQIGAAILLSIGIVTGAFAATAGPKLVEDIKDRFENPPPPFKTSGSIMHHVQGGDTIWNIVEDSIANKEITVEGGIDHRDVMEFIEETPANAEAFSDKDNLIIGSDIVLPKEVEKN